MQVSVAATAQMVCERHRERAGALQGCCGLQSWGCFSGASASSGVIRRDSVSATWLGDSVALGSRV